MLRRCSRCCVPACLMIGGLVCGFALATRGNAQENPTEPKSPFAQGKKLRGDLSDLLKIANDRADKQTRQPPSTGQPRVDPPPRAALPKSEIPDLVAQEKLLQEIEEIFGRPDTASEKLVLAKQLMSASRDEKDSNTRYVLLRYGGTLAIEGGSSLLAIQAVDDLSRSYTFDASAMKAAVLDRVLSKNTAPEILNSSLQHFDQCLADDNYDVAKQFGRIAFRAAGLIGHTEAIGLLQQRAKRMRELKAAFDVIVPAVTVLKTKPDDVPANRQIGEYFCFMKGNWKKGLPFLADGDHPAALLEAANPRDALAMKQVADLWWSEAVAATSAKKNHLQRRAGKWYTDALGRGLEGLARVAVEKRLREIPALAPPKALAATTDDVPLSAADRQEALRTVAETYRTEYQLAKTAADKSTLAQKMLRAASVAKNDRAVRWALLKSARDIAAGAGDGETALAAIDAMTPSQQGDVFDMKLAVLTTVVKTVSSLEDERALVPLIGKVFEQAIADDDLDVARRLGRLASLIARRSKHYEGEKYIKKRLAELDEIEKQHESAKSAIAALKADPSDPAANLTVGKLRCFTTGNWDQGLPLLARGSDPALKRLAEQELAKPTAADAQLKLADGWWDQAGVTSSPIKNRLQDRAAQWYRQAIAGGLSGLSKVRAAKRSEEVKPVAVATTKTSSRGSKTHGFHYLRLDVWGSGAMVQINDLVITDLSKKKNVYANNFNTGNLDDLVLRSTKDVEKNQWAFDRLLTGISELRLRLDAPRIAGAGRSGSTMMMSRKLPKNFAVDFEVYKPSSTGDFLFRVFPEKSLDGSPVFKTSIERHLISSAMIFSPKETNILAGRPVPIRSVLRTKLGFYTYSRMTHFRLVKKGRELALFIDGVRKAYTADLQAPVSKK